MERKRRNAFVRSLTVKKDQITRYSIKKAKQLVNGDDQKPEDECEDMEMQSVRYKPEGIEALCKATKFSRKELQIMYRGFKQECPSGIVNEDTFKDIYAQFFPQGDSSAYAHYVFSSFDPDNSGSISFEMFMVVFSIITRGTQKEKLKCAFKIYDVDKDGLITREDMIPVVNAIYNLMGNKSKPPIDPRTSIEHVETVFRKMDTNKDGVISMEEFMNSCKMDESVSKNMCMFDTVI